MEAGSLASALASKGPAAAAKLLSSGDIGEKCAAAQALGILGDAAAPHAAELAQLLSDGGEDEAVLSLAKACVVSRPEAAQRLPKCAASEALPRLGAPGRAFAGAVAQLLQDGNPEVRAAAAASLGEMGSEGSAHEPALLALLAAEGDPRVLSAGAVALARLSKAKGQPGQAAADAILKLLSSQHPGVRAGAAAALGHLGAASAAHASRLVACLTDRCPKVKIAAVGAIAELGVPGQVYAADVARLSCDEWQLSAVRVAALEALSTMGKRGEALADDIAELLHVEEEDVRVAAFAALGRLGVGLGYSGLGQGLELAPWG